MKDIYNKLLLVTEQNQVIKEKPAKILTKYNRKPNTLLNTRMGTSGRRVVAKLGSVLQVTEAGFVILSYWVGGEKLVVC